MTIIEQQLELHFGNEYPLMVRRSRRTVGWMLKIRRGQTLRNQVWTGEGGEQGMITNLLCHVMTQGDYVEGLRSYSRYLSQEYQQWRYDTIVSLDAPDSFSELDERLLSDIGIPDGGVTGVAVDFGSLPAVPETAYTLERLTPWEREVCEVIATLEGKDKIAETARILDKSVASIDSAFRSARRKLDPLNICEVDECTAGVHAKGLCNKHYKIWG